MDAWLKEAFFHRPCPNIAGRQLYPLCFRHLIGLYTFENRYVTGDSEDIGIAALAQAVFVCSSKDERQLQQVFWNDEKGQQELRNIAVELGKEETAETAFDAFADYWHDFCQYAELAETTANKLRSRKPWQCHWTTISTAILIDGGYAEQRAWWMPLGEALAMKLALLETNPNFDFKVFTEKEKAKFESLGWKLNG